MPRRKGRFTAPPQSSAALRTEQTAVQPSRRRGIYDRLPPDTMPVKSGTARRAARCEPMSSGNLWFFGSMANPLGFPGWGGLYTGNYPTYRWMLKHPVLWLADSNCTSVIRSNTWDFTSRKGTPQAQVDAVSATFGRLRPQMIKMLVQARRMGWCGAEPIWTYVRGRYDIDRLKFLVPEVTEILQDDHGNAVGLRNHVSVPGSNKPYIDLSMWYKAWKYTYNGEDHYGESWLEHVRSSAWVGWLDCAQRLARLGAKITGIVTIIKSPAGIFKGPDGRKVTYKAAAKQIIQDLANGAAGVWWPSLGLAPDARGSLDTLKVLAELAQKSLTSIDVVDMSGNSQAISPILEEMKHYEELMFNGAQRSARTGLEANHGTKEEAGVHTDTGTVNAEAEEEEFASAMQPAVDAFLAINFGEPARGAVSIKPNSLVDRKAAVLRAVLMAMLNNPLVVEEIVRTGDIDKALDLIDFPRKPGTSFNGENVAKAAAESRQKGQLNQTNTKNPEPQGGRIPADQAA